MRRKLGSTLVACAIVAVLPEAAFAGGGTLEKAEDSAGKNEVSNSASSKLESAESQLTRYSLGSNMVSPDSFAPTDSCGDFCLRGGASVRSTGNGQPVAVAEIGFTWTINSNRRRLARAQERQLNAIAAQAEAAARQQMMAVRLMENRERERLMSNLSEAVSTNNALMVKMLSVELSKQFGYDDPKTFLQELIQTL